MKHLSKYLVLFLVLMLVLQACNLPSKSSAATDEPAAPGGTQEPVSVDMDQALTFAAQTIAAGATATFTEGPPTNTPIVGVTLSVSSETNCRTGPSTDYDILMVMKPGMTAPVVGKYGGSFYIIEYPGGFGAKCWIWNQYATVIGDTSTLVEGVPPPLPPTPTPAPMAPAPPKGVHTSCVSQNASTGTSPFIIIKFRWTVTLSWKDQSANENGFHIYKNGALIGSVGPNQTSYVDVFIQGLVLQGSINHVYAVQSFNDYGSSELKDVEISSCP